MYKRKSIAGILILLFLIACQSASDKKNQDLAARIMNDEKLDKVSQMAHDLIKTGFSAGTAYSEVWIRDYNTFIEVSCEVLPRQIVHENLIIFFNFQGKDGNIIDGFIPREKVGSVSYDYIYTDQAPDYAGHKNTVETDQECSLVQAVSKYIKKTGDQSILQELVFGKTVQERLQLAMKFLLMERYSEKYGLIWGATTADWGDVQPEHEWGVVLDENSHRAIDIYDNAMFVIALGNLVDMLDEGEERKYWTKIRDKIKSNIRAHLWDEKLNKFIPHIYLKGSPFPQDFDENNLHYHGGSAIAIEAGVLTKNEIAIVNTQMLKNQQESGAQSIGLTIYPPYPEGYFKNPAMHPYGYQNGGDWTWFGGRMIQQLVNYGFIEEAYQEIQPMVNRVLENHGFYEWYTIEGKATGAGKYRGSAGVLAKAIKLLKDWAEANS